MKIVASLVFLFIMNASVHTQTDVSQENAANLLKVLSNDIGPRPMGSPAEHRALQFAAGKFKEYGCDTSYIMKMDRSSRANTTSGIAVGMKRGATKRIIIIGGHIDSAGPEIPGADDDGSGSATVMELARVIGKRNTQSTIVFCCFGGEEQGLEGSQYFADHFENIDSVAMMLQVDMANGLGIIDLDPDMHARSAPRWLVQAAVEEFYNLGYEHLRYPTHFFSINYAASRGSGSDHESFLNKGIPAIDFSTDVSKPIHTPRDNFENFDPRGLKRSGDILLKLFERFDAGTPNRETEQYWLYLFGKTPIFIPFWGIWLFIAIAFALAVAGFVAVRKRREPPDIPDRIRWSGVKMFLFTIIIVTCGWFSSDIVAFIKGDRFPWFANLEPYYFLAAIAMLIGCVITAAISGKLLLSKCPYVYYKRSMIALLVFLILLMLANIKLAVEPAMALFLVSLAILIRKPYLKLLLVILSSIWMLRLIFSEWDGLLFRSIAGSVPASVAGYGIFSVVMILLYSLCLAPFSFAFAAVVRDAPGLLYLVRLLKSRGSFIFSIVAFACFVAYLSFKPSYDQLWYRDVEAEETFDMNKHSTEISLSSPDYLAGVSVHHGDKDTLIGGRSVSAKINPISPFDTTWLTIDRHQQGRQSGDTTNYVIELTLTTKKRPYTVVVSYSGSKEKSVEGFDTPWMVRDVPDAPSMAKKVDNTKRITWYSFPDTVIRIPVRFQTVGNDSVKEKIEVTFDTLAYPMKFRRELTYFIPRTKYVANWIYKK